MHVKYCNHLCGVKEIHLVRLAKTLILSKNLFTVPKTETMETRYSTVLKTVFAILISSLFVFSTQTAKAQLDFSSPVLVSGTDMQPGAVYKYFNVAANANGTMTIDSIIGGATILHMDDNGFGFASGFQPMIKSGGRGISYVVFTFKLEDKNTGLPIQLASLTANLLDIDGNNNLNEFADIEMGGGIATYMSPLPQIALANTGGKISGINTAGIEVGGIDTTALEVMYQVNQTNVNSMRVRFGTFNTTNSQSTRQYSLYFRTFSLSNFSSLPLTLLNFDATLKSEKVNLSWSTTNHKDFSHFVLQRSTNGRDFKDVMTMMTDATDFSTVHQYAYKDDVSNANATVIYYRLQMVDADAKFEYSPIRMVRINAVAAVQIQVFPNPVTSELRVTIPISWQEKNVTYEIYNSNGSLINRLQKNNAVQIQQLNVSSLGSGNYIIRVTNGQEISTTKFIKH